MTLIYTFLAGFSTLAVGVLTLIGRRECAYESLITDYSNIKGARLAYGGLQALEISGYGFQSSYDQTMIRHYAQLLGKEHALWAYRLNVAVKIVFGLLSVSGLFALAALGLLKHPEHFLIAVGCAAALVMGNDLDVQKQVASREKVLRYQFPNFINQMSLLISAGMSPSGAWCTIAESLKRKDALTHELKRSALQFASGLPEQLVLEDFAERCNTVPIRKFTTVLSQSMKKGTGDVVTTIQLIAAEQWAERKAFAVREAEKSSSKMLMPLGLILIGLLMVVLTPMALQIMTLF
jgi:tight adherence protein C